MTRRAIAARLSVSFYLDRNHSLVRESSEFPPFPRISDCFLLARSEIFLSLRNSMQTNESNGMLQATFCFSDTAKHRQTPPNTAKCRRNRPALDNSFWLQAGVRRCPGIFQNGRDFLQQLADQHDTRDLISSFFESLKSKRRLPASR